MNAAIWRSLLWKEWREHRWKLAALVTIAIACTLGSCLISREEGVAWGFVSGFEIVYFALAVLWPIYLAMGAAASERSQSTLPFLQCLPVSLQVAGLLKLVLGILTAWMPIIAAMWVTEWMLAVGVEQHWLGVNRAVEEFENIPAAVFFNNHKANLLLTSLLMISSIFVWVTAFGVNRESEVRAAAFGLVGITVAWGIALLTALLLDFPRDAMPLISALPGGIFISIGEQPRSNNPARLTTIAAFLATHLPLAWWYVGYFGKTSESKHQQRTATNLHPSKTADWLGPPRRSAWSALIWKQLRESAPIVLIAFTAAIGFAAMNYALGSLDMWIRDLQATENFEVHLRDQSIRTAQVMLIYLGCAAGFVAGIGTTISELQPRLLQFWRSRPINIDQWFGFSIATNVTILTMAFALPAILCSRFSNWGSDGISPEAMIYSLLLSYASTLLMACVVRHAVYAGILGLSLFGGVLFLGYQLTQIPGADAYERPLMAAVALSSAALLTFLAWVCVRNDWSLRLS